LFLSFSVIARGNIAAASIPIPEVTLWPGVNNAIDGRFKRPPQLILARKGEDAAEKQSLSLLAVMTENLFEDEIDLFTLGGRRNKLSPSEIDQSVSIVPQSQ